MREVLSVIAVDADPGLRELLVETLAPRCAVRAAATLEEGLGLLAAAAADAVILDYTAGGGAAGVRRVREQAGLPGPALIVTGGALPQEAVLDAFAAGADDVVGKPFNPVELHARLAAIARRRPRAKRAAPNLVSGALEMEHATHAVRVDGAPVTLTPREYFLLRTLMEHPGEVFSKERLLRHLFGEQEASSGGSIEVHLSNLRRKLGSESQRISTVRGAGYRLEKPS